MPPDAVPGPSNDRERAETATAALAQLIATTEEFHRRASAAEALARATQGEARLADERIANTLHDTVAQSLTSAHRFLEAARASMQASRHEAAATQLDAAQEAVLAAIAELRSVIAGLAAAGGAR